MNKKRFLKFFPRCWHIYIFKIKLVIKHPSILIHWNKSFKVLNEPVLIVSLPRSGSSWLGKVLAQADNIRYLREPITSAYMKSSAKGSASFFSPSKCLNPDYYQKLANTAFGARLNFTHGMVSDYKHWLNPSKELNLLIKEVNPLYLSALNKCFKLKIIYLERHPYSVAKSFAALGWSNYSIFNKRFDENEIAVFLKVEPNLLTASFYYQFGFLQGAIKALNEKSLQQPNIIQVNYEALVSNPVEEVRRLTQFIGIKGTNKIENYIMNSLQNEKVIDAGSFCTRRNKDVILETLEAEKKEPGYAEVCQAFSLAYNELKSIL